MNDKIKLALLAVVALIVFFFLKGKSHRHHAAKEPATAEEKPAKHAPVFKAAPGVNKEALAQYTQDATAGLIGANYNRTANGGMALSVALQPKSVCYAADFEAMALATGNEGILLSLESLDGGKAPATKLLSTKELYQGMVVDFPVNIEKPGTYALYLCGDSSGSGSCGRKKAAAVEDILKSPKLARTHGDEIYFFQLLVLEQTEALTFDGQIKDLPKAAASLGGHGIDEKAAEAATATAARMMARTKSMPVKPTRKGNKLVMAIDIPFLGCGQPTAH